MPEIVVKALQLLLLALFGAIFVQFAMSKLKLAPIILALCLLLAIGVRKGVIPGFAPTPITVFTSIAIFFIRRTSSSKEPGYEQRYDTRILDVIPRLSRGILLFDNSLKQQTSLSEPLKAEQGGFL